MDPTSTGHQAQPDTAARVELDGDALLYRQALEAASDLNQLREPGRMVETIARILQRMPGMSEGVVKISGRRLPARRLAFGSEELAEEGSPRSRSVEMLLQKVLDEGRPLVDGSRGLVFPLAHGSQVSGAVFVTYAGDERRRGRMMDVLLIVGRLCGASLENCQHAADLAIVDGQDDEFRPIATLSLREAKLGFEKRLLKARLRESEGNIAAAARSLGMDRGQLSRLLKKHKVDKNDYRPGAGTAAV